MNRQNILLIVLVLSLAAGAYIWYAYLYDSGEDVVTEEESLISPQFLAKAALLDRIQIDTEFFRSGVFAELEAGPPLPSLPEEINGRANPFAQF